MTRLKRIEIEVDDDLIQDVIQRFGVRSPREAIHLALRTLLGDAQAGESSQDDEYDEFSDLNAWVPKKATDTR